jgi:hypothetical protein
VSPEVLALGPWQLGPFILSCLALGYLARVNQPVLRLWGLCVLRRFFFVGVGDDSVARGQVLYFFYFNMGERMLLRAIFVRSCKIIAMYCLLHHKPFF